MKMVPMKKMLNLDECAVSNKKLGFPAFFDALDHEPGEVIVKIGGNL